MGMGIVSDKDFDSELSKLESPVNKEPESKSEPDGKIVDINRGRGNNPATPDSLRKLIGSTAIEDGRPEALRLAENFGVSPSSVSAYTQGAHSTSSYNDRPDEGHINDTKNSVAKRAMNKLKASLRHITDEKLGEAKARDLAGIAKDMSAVIRNMEPDNKKPSDVERGPTFIFYSPHMKKEEVFEVIDVKE